MKLLFDQNLSHRLTDRLDDLFPGSGHVRQFGLHEASDLEVHQFARLHGFVLVTLDSDFADLAHFFGAPPKVVWLRCGNQSTPIVEDLVRRHFAEIVSFGESNTAACMEFYL